MEVTLIEMYGGKGLIVSYPPYTFGNIIIYKEETDSFIQIKASVKCSNNDTFDLQKGVRLVKIKLARQYHRYNKQYTTSQIQKYRKKLKSLESQLEYYNRKIENSQRSFDKLGGRKQ